jgi:hypothetical protein
LGDFRCLRCRLGCAAPRPGIGGGRHGVRHARAPCRNSGRRLDDRLFRLAAAAGSRDRAAAPPQCQPGRCQGPSGDRRLAGKARRHQ